MELVPLSIDSHVVGVPDNQFIVPMSNFPDDENGITTNSMNFMDFAKEAAEAMSLAAKTIENGQNTMYHDGVNSVESLAAKTIENGQNTMYHDWVNSVDSEGFTTGPKVQKASDHVYKVSTEACLYVVNLESKTCTCNRFQMDELPCSHAIRVNRSLHIDPLPFCSSFYKTKNFLETYAEPVSPI
ncbi:MuDR family transposase [Striga hermonthica]|uniref:MuDR family transposase n=1 Tax=Striga hermonthica TaxID=68872 RepID=A0A9N7NKN7_STRHE|nr:MuDR family transposase [Striga hermonthica]